MATKTEVEEAVEWYSERISLYATLARRVESIVREVLDSKEINYHSVTSRVKSIKSYREKASREEYKDPRSEIMDMAGARIITYVDSDAKKAAEIVQGSFEINPKHTVDKTQELGTDRVGYRSIHCVGTLGKKRTALPEYMSFSNLCFEIQIRTILQHAWAEFEHDRNYKFKGVLPNELKRRLMIVAGNLELADREFEAISHAVGDYISEVQKKTQLGDLNTPINSASLMAYLNERFKQLVVKGLRPRLVYDARIIEELSYMKINTLQELDEAIPKAYVEVYSKYHVGANRWGTYAGLLRHIMMLKDADAYFKTAWRGSWRLMRSRTASLLRHYGVDLDKYIKLYGIDVH